MLEEAVEFVLQACEAIARALGIGQVGDLARQREGRVRVPGTKNAPALSTPVRALTTWQSMRLSCGLWGAAAFAAALALGPSQALAGNDEGILMGNQAAMTGGAVTATVSEGSALWYNPAGLSAVSKQSLDLSASLYGVRLYAVPRFLTASDGSAADVDVTELVSIPSALAYVRPLTGDFVLGFGLFVPRANDYILRGDLDSAAAGRWLVTEAQYERLTYGGVGLGWSVTRRLRLGVSLLSFLDFEQTGIQVGGGNVVQPPESATFISTSEIATRTSVGGMLAVGIQAQPTDALRFGLSLRTPSLNVYNNGHRATLTTGSVQEPTGPLGVYLPDVESSSRSDLALTRPVQARLGVAYALARSWVALDGDIAPGLHQTNGQSQDPKFNVRLGGQAQLTDYFALGAGLFTDRDAASDATGTGKLDFYGASVGARMGTHYEVQKEGAEEHGTFDFMTTVALRYARARADTGSVTIAPITDAASLAAFARAQTTTLTIHEIALHVGSGFYF